MSDGTTTGTRRVADIRVGTSSSNPAYITPLGSKVLFAADDGVKGSELWSADCTTGAASLVADLNAGGVGSAPEYLQVLGGKVYFTSTPLTTLYATDGTSAGTVAIASVSTIQPLTVANGFLWFGATVTGAGVELCVRLAGRRSTDTHQRCHATGIMRCLLIVRRAACRWRSDGTSAGTTNVADINAGTGSSLPKFVTALNPTTVLLQATDSSGAEL